MIGAGPWTHRFSNVFLYSSSLTTELDTTAKISSGCFTVRRTVLKRGQQCGFHLSTKLLHSHFFLLFGPLLVPFQVGN